MISLSRASYCFIKFEGLAALNLYIIHIAIYIIIIYIIYTYYLFYVSNGIFIFVPRIVTIAADLFCSEFLFFNQFL